MTALSDFFTLFVNHFTVLNYAVNTKFLSRRQPAGQEVNQT